MTHTPGPWKILRHDLGDEEIFFVPVEILAGNGKLVVAHEGGLAPINQEWTCEEIEANGSLIEAAPEMLDALVEVKMRIEEYITTCPLCGGSAERGHKYYCLWHVANDAIRKARGKNV